MLLLLLQLAMTAEMTSLAIDDVVRLASMTRLKRWRHAAEIDDDVRPFTD